MSILGAAAITLGSGVVKGMLGKRSSDKQAAAARQQAARNADLSWMTTEEELRRVDVENAKIMSSIKAISSASGFSSGGSNQAYVENLSTEMQAERDWLQMSGKATAENIRQGGEYTAQEITNRGRSEAISSALSGLQMFGSSQNWWMS